MANESLEKLMAKYVARTPHMADAGMRVTEVQPARGTMHLPPRPDWVGDPARQVLHPGVLTVLADSACGLAVSAALTERMPIATLDLRMDYLRPAGPEHEVWCEAHCFRKTRSVGFVRAEVWQDDRAQPIATAQGAFMLATPAGPRHPAAGAAEPAPPSAHAPAAATSATQAQAQAQVQAQAPAWQPPAASAPVPVSRPIPYVDYLGVRVAPDAAQPLYRLPYQPKLIGNPWLPALHGGVIAGFAETAAMLHLVQNAAGAKLPKGIDFSIDYLRSGRPEETFAACELVRVGARVALVLVRCWQSRGPSQPIAVARGHFLLADAA